MTDKDKLLYEIEKLEKENCMNKGEHFCMRRAICLGKLRQIVNSMQEEPVSEDLDKEIERIIANEDKYMKFQVRGQLIEYVARYFAAWQKQKDNLPASKDLEDLVEQYCNDCRMIYDGVPDFAIGRNWN